MNKKTFSFLGMALVVLMLSACSQQAPQASQEWSSESMPTGQTEETSTEAKEAEATDKSDSQEALKPQVGIWMLDTKSSTLAWSASKVVGTPHTGTVGIKEGSLEVGEQGFKGGQFVIDMTSIKESKNDEAFLKHVTSDDFFGVEKYPESKLVLKSITSKGGDQYAVKADLTIRGITNEIDFDATVKGDADRLSIQSKFNIDRTKWDIKFNSSSFVQNLGDNAIKDEIEYTLDLVFTPKAA